MADSALPRVNAPGAVALLNEAKGAAGSASSYVVGHMNAVMEID